MTGTGCFCNLPPSSRGLTQPWSAGFVTWRSRTIAMSLIPCRAFGLRFARGSCGTERGVFSTTKNVGHVHSAACSAASTWSWSRVSLEDSNSRGYRSTHPRHKAIHSKMPCPRSWSSSVHMALSKTQIATETHCLQGANLLLSCHILILFGAWLRPNRLTGQDMKSTLRSLDETADGRVSLKVCAACADEIFCAGWACC